MAFKRIATSTCKKSNQANPSEYSYVVPMGTSRKKQLSKEVNELFQGKRETVKACVSEIIEIVSEHEISI